MKICQVWRWGGAWLDLRRENKTQRGPEGIAKNRKQRISFHAKDNFDEFESSLFENRSAKWLSAGRKERQVRDFGSFLCFLQFCIVYPICNGYPDLSWVV